MYQKIVLFDDDIDDAELFLEALAENDPSIMFTHFHEERQGLDTLLGAHCSKPDLIFLDINMPSLSGWQCLRMLKASEITNKIPVLMYTTSSEDREKQIAQDLGAAGFITKPTDYNNLKELLRLILSTSPLDLANTLNDSGKSFQTNY